ncbi:MAG: nucleotide exchange factor GrpE [Alistipes sp.]|nr:nucleotide exchange factor GrpE [Alistipes sp.]MBQ1979541.1 nucleotide exchange factor GrpE [Alistipes sp.]
MKQEKIYNEEVAAEAELPVDEPCAADESQTNANVADEETTATDTMADASAAEDELVKLAAEVAEWKDKYVRLQAEFDNYRKRTLREKMELVETGGKEVLLAMLPVKDDVERAVAAMFKTEDLESVRQGVQLIAQKFTEALKQRGVTQIEVVGQPFDEEVAEAVARFAAGEEQKGLVIDCVQTGYRLGERVLRFAKVVVGE